MGRRVSLPVVLSPLDQRLRRRHRAKGGVFAFAPTVGLVDAEAGVGVVRLVPPGDVDMHGWVDAGRVRGCMVVGGGVDMCARQLFGCRLVVPETSCPWWPLFPGNPSSGARSLRHKTGSNICAVAAPVPAPASHAISAALGGYS